MAASASQAGAAAAEDMEDDGGLAWYAAAAAGESDDEEEEEGDEEAGEDDPLSASQDPYLASDPYLAADPYSEVGGDPYADVEAEEKAPEPVEASASPSPEATAAAAAAAPATTAAAAATAAAAPAATDAAKAAATAAEKLAAAFAAEFLPEPDEAPTTPSTSSTSVPAGARLATGASTAAAAGTATSIGRSRGADVHMSEEEAAGARRRGPEGQLPEQPPAKAQKTQAQVQTLPPAQPPASPQAPPASQRPSPGSQEGGPEKPGAEKPTHAQVQPEPAKPGAGPEAAAMAPVPEAEGPPPPEAEGEEPAVLDLPDGGEGDEVWDARVLVVRQGQVHIEIQHRKPPMQDATLLRFCDWLDQQLPVVVANFPYVRKSGAYVDLSDNIIGPEGLDKLFQVLREHRVPCVVMKAYRNVLDDSIVDTLIEYLYTQPEGFPMHGIHISHNNISDKGALRLIRAASLCGHYPRLSSRLPLWLRLEANDIQSPNKLLADCHKEGFNVCLMGNGLCSRPDCNHYSGVHVQLPYFFHQGRKGQDQYQKERSVAKAHSPALVPPPAAAPAPAPALGAPAPEAVALPGGEASVGGEAQVIDVEEALPDWKRNQKLDTKASFMVAAPKTANFRPAPKRPAGRRPGAAEVPAESAEDAIASEAPGSGDAPMLVELPPVPMGIQTVVRPSAPGGLDQPAPPLGPPPMEVYAAAMRLNALGSAAKSGMPAPRPPPPGAAWFPEGDAGFDAGWKGHPPQKGRGRGGGGRGGGGWKGKEGGGRGGGGGGKGWGSNKMWQGPSLQSKAKKDVRLAEGENDLGLQWRFLTEGKPPKILAVIPGSKVSEVAQPGDSLLRVNGLDTSMFSERQIADMLKQRPLSLRFGDD